MNIFVYIQLVYMSIVCAYHDIIDTGSAWYCGVRQDRVGYTAISRKKGKER